MNTINNILKKEDRVEILSGKYKGFVGIVKDFLLEGTIAVEVRKAKNIYRFSYK